jgi:hypothetical protein
MYMRHEPEPHVLLFKVKPYRLPPRQRADLFIPRIEGKGLRPKAPTVDGTSFTAPSATTTTRLPGLDVATAFQQHMVLRLLGDKPQHTTAYPSTASSTSSSATITLASLRSSFTFSTFIR